MYRSCVLFAIAAGWSFAGTPAKSLDSSRVQSLTSEIRFEPNLGQADPKFQYFARSERFVLGLTATGNELVAGNVHVRTRLVGAVPGVAPEPLDAMSSITN